MTKGLGMGTVKRLRIDELITGGELQMRTSIDADHIERLIEAFLGGQNVPPIRVLFDSESYFVWDGTHRVLAAARAGNETIDCDIEAGTRRDAMLLAAGANYDHGLPRTNHDKRRAVLSVLRDSVWAMRSDRWISQSCRVSRALVSDIRLEMQDAGKTARTAAVKGLDGKTYRSSGCAKQEHIAVDGFLKEAYYETQYWASVSKARKNKDRFRCTQCGAGKNLETHHWRYDLFHENVDRDLITFCRSCHERLHQAISGSAVRFPKFVTAEVAERILLDASERRRAT